MKSPSDVIQVVRRLLLSFSPLTLRRADFNGAPSALHEESVSSRRLIKEVSQMKRLLRPLLLKAASALPGQAQGASGPLIFEMSLITSPARSSPMSEA